MSSNRLNLEQALLLYDLIGAHVPKEIDDQESVLNFVGKIVGSMVNHNQHRHVIQAVMLLTGQTQAEVLDLPLGDLMVAFTEGLVRENILMLCRFCEGLYGRTQRRR